MRAREFTLKEDEYSAVQNQLGKNPNLRKVNAYTANITDPDTRKYIHKLEPMTPAELAQWKGRAAKLLARCQAIYAKLKTVMLPEDAGAANGVKITVPITGEGAWAAADFNDKTISFDVGCFWDLSDDCIAYVLGHEMGHIVWAFGPKKNWPKTRGQKVTPAQRRQEEMDADVYGCRLAMQLGYDRRKAFEHFTLAYQREPFDPSIPYYPSVGQRKANIEKDVKSRADAAAQAQQKAVEPQQQEPAPQQPNPDMAEKNAWLNHIMQGMRRFEVALAQDPNLAQA
jgi:hypothetical protein